MYQGPMSKVVVVGAASGGLFNFGPFDKDDEVVAVVLQTHSDGAALALLSVDIKRVQGSALPTSAVEGIAVTDGPIEVVSPVAFDGLIRIPVNVIFQTREILQISLNDVSAGDDHHGMIGIVFVGGHWRGGVRGGGGGGGGT
jgi:hypothetical protein